VAVAVTLAGTALRAEQILLYSFPASWDGTGTVVTDLSPAGNHGTTAGAAALSTNVPPGAPAGDRSLAPVAGGIRTDNLNLLENPTIAPAGGFVMEATILWNGAHGTHTTVQKIIDSEGTESLQLQNIDIANGTADLRFQLNDFDGVTMQIVANEWYNVQGIFDSRGNSIDGSGHLAGTAKLIVNGSSVSQAVTRKSVDTGGMGTASDTLNRPIAVGAFSAAPSIVTFSGFIYNPSVRLVPEPASMVLFAMGVATWFASAHRRRCRSGAC
jgi:hypothetical protein